MIDTARELIEKGYSVTPVKEKIPYLKDWPNIKNVLECAWSQADGLGLILGRELICLDIDIETPNELTKELDKLLPAAIYCGVEGNRKRPPARLFKYNGEKSEKFLKLKIEILSKGNQKVIPPSRHPSGVNYKWVGFNLLHTDIDEFPILDSEIINFLRRANGSAVSPEFEISDKDRCESGSHTALSEFAVKYFHQGWTFEELVTQCIEKDKEINDGKIKYFQCPTRRWKGTSIFTNAHQFVGEIFYRGAYKSYNTKTFFQEERANGFTYSDPDKPKSHPKRLHVALYNYMKCKNDIWYCPEIKSFQIWDGKKYDVKPEDTVKKFAQDNFKHPPCTAIADKATFLDYAKHAQQSPVKDFLLSDKGLINLQNGIFDLNSKRLIKHNKKYRLPYVIDVPWVNDGNAPTWSRLLNLITKNRVHMNQVIEEFIGYAVSCCKYQKLNKLLILDGSGSNGKSTLIRVIQQLIGYENTSSVSLDSITKEKFAGYSLVNKLINFCSEEPKEAFSNTGAIKKITGGDTIMVEEKFKGSFQYFNIAKLIISYNRMPFFPDDSTGMKRRIILIPCEMDFDKEPKKRIKDPEAHIFANERSQVLYRCVRAYYQVIKRGCFTDVAEGALRVEEMIRDSNPVLSFIEECVEATGVDEHVYSVGELYEKFVLYQGGQSKVKKNTFCRRFSSALKSEPKITFGFKKIFNSTRRSYSGLRIVE